MFVETKELPVTAPAKVGRYRCLADDMRKGAAETVEIHGPGFGMRFGQIYATCAIGAIAFGRSGDDFEKWKHEWHSLMSNEWLNPLMGQIVGRFEHEHQTREQIADWLDSL